MTLHRSIQEWPISYILVSLVMAACGPPALDEEGEEPVPILAAGPDLALDPGAFGPYPVGVETIWLEDPTRPDPDQEELPRRFRVEIWYPAEESARSGEYDVIRATEETPDSLSHLLEDMELLAVSQPAYRDAEPRTDQGLFPIVLFSHGMGAIRYQSFTYTAHLASHGYVVLAPDHAGDTLFDLLAETNVESSVLVALVNRPQDLSLILDRIEEGALTDGWLEAISDIDRVAITGHSFGGLVSVLMTHPDSEFFDPRPLASVPITPATEVLGALGAGELSEITVPILYVGATEDRTLDYQKETVDAYEAHLPDKAMVAVKRAGHYSFTEVCDMGVADAARDLGMESTIEAILRDGCGEENIPVEAAYARLNYYATAWLNTYIRGSDETPGLYLDPELAPEDVVYRLDREE